MVRLNLAAPRPARSRHEIVAEAERVGKLLKSDDFGGLINRTADRIVTDWSKAKSPEVREGYWYQLQGLDALLRTMEITVDHGRLE